MPKGMLGKLPLSAVQGPVDALWEKLASDKGPRVLEELNKFNREDPCWLPEEKVKARAKNSTALTPLLRPNGHAAAVVLTARHDPDVFYQTRDGLYVDGDFRRRIVAAAKPTEVGTKFKKLPRFLLSRNATGEDLKSARPKAVFTATEFCPWLAAKIAQQPKGEAGDLAIDQWNLFLVEGFNGGVFLVYVYWSVGRQRWSVGTWRLTDEWGADRQFFPRN